MKTGLLLQFLIVQCSVQVRIDKKKFFKRSFLPSKYKNISVGGGSGSRIEIEKLRQRDPGYFWWCLIDDTSWKISAFSTESRYKEFDCCDCQI